MGQFSKDFKDLEFYDNYIFCKVMQDETICKKMLEILLNLQVEKIEYLNTEQTIENVYDSMGIRMDVYIKDSNRIIDIEMQTGDYEDLILRARYYQSSSDIASVPRRTKYRELKEIFILFICRDDPFGAGIPCYTKKSEFVETDRLSYNDKTHNVFYNASAYALAEDEDVRDVLRFINTLKAGSEFTKNLAESVKKAKSRLTFKDEYMYFQDILEDEKEQAREKGLTEGREKGLAEGRAKGLVEGRAEGLVAGKAEGLTEGIIKGKLENQKETAKRLLKLNLSVEQIIQITDLSYDEIIKIKNN